tara:strand:- start:726 stop:902 length:177 start_codon:yes stop_codon:yes gene_type:complete
MANNLTIKILTTNYKVCEVIDTDIMCAPHYGVLFIGEYEECKHFIYKKTALTELQNNK